MLYLYDYKYSSLVYAGLASFESQRHKLVKFGKRNICSCHFGIFERNSHLLGFHKSYFANVHEVFLFYFEVRINV